MCILLATRAHPRYDLILISNRDEFFNRKTHETCWHNNGRMLSPYDMATLVGDQEPQGTWCGVGRQGKVATVLNLRLESTIDLSRMLTKKSRGKLPSAYLLSQDNGDEWYGYEKFAQQYPDLTDTNDFNLFYGNNATKKYEVIDSQGQSFNVLTTDDFEKPTSYMVLSNDLYERPGEWGKLDRGKKLLKEWVAEKSSAFQDDKDVIAKCTEIAMCCDMVPDANGQAHALKHPEITNSTIYVPPLKVDQSELPCHFEQFTGKYFGTRSQIFILVPKGSNKVKFVERVLYNSDDDVEHPNRRDTVKTTEFEFEF